MIKIKNVKFRNKLLEEVKGLEPIFSSKYNVSLFGVGMDAYGSIMNMSNIIHNNKGKLRLSEALYLIDNNLYLLDTEENLYYTFEENILNKYLEYIIDFFKTESILMHSIISFVDDRMVKRFRAMNIPDNIHDKFYKDKCDLLVTVIKYTGNATINRLSNGDMPTMSVLVGDVLEYIIQNYAENISDFMTDKKYMEFYQELLSGIYDYIKLHIIYMMHKIYITRTNRYALDGYKYFKNYLLSNFTDNKVLDALCEIMETTDDEIYEVAKNNTPEYNKAYDILKVCVDFLNNKDIIQDEKSVKNMTKGYFKLVNQELDINNQVAVFGRSVLTLTTLITSYNRIANIDKTTSLRQDDYEYNVDCNKFILENNADIFCIFDNHKWTNVIEMTERLTLSDYRKHNTNLIKNFKTIGFCCPFMSSLSQFDIIGIKNENFKLVLLDPEIDEDENMFNDFMMDQTDDFDSKEEFESVYNDVYNKFYYDDDKYGLIYYNNRPILLINLDNTEYNVEAGAMSYNKHLFEGKTLTPAEKREILIQNGIYPKYYENTNTEYLMLQDIDRMCITRQVMVYTFELLKYLEEKQTDSGINIKMVELELTKGRKNKHKSVTFEITERKSSWVRAHYRHYKSGIVTLVTAHHRKGCHVNTNNEKLIINL